MHKKQQELIVESTFLESAKQSGKLSMLAQLYLTKNYF